MLQLKATIRRTVAETYFRARIHRLLHRGKVVIATYHRVLPRALAQSGVVQSGMYVSDADFDAQLRFLKTNFTILSLEELLILWEQKRWNPRQRYCVVTLDDGWADNYQYAFPILKQHHVPATIFLAVDFIGTTRWFWPDRFLRLFELLRGAETQEKTKTAFWQEVRSAVDEREDHKDARSWESTPIQQRTCDEIIEQLKMVPLKRIEALLLRLRDLLEVPDGSDRLLLTWEEVREMAESGVSFGSHGCSHQILTTLSKPEVERELRVSWQTLRDHHLAPVPAFCYPNGNYDEEIQDLVRRCGYRAALSCRKGHEAGVPDDLFALKRVDLHHDISCTVPLFSFALAGLR